MSAMLELPPHLNHGWVSQSIQMHMEYEVTQLIRQSWEVEKCPHFVSWLKGLIIYHSFSALGSWICCGDRGSSSPPSLSFKLRCSQDYVHLELLSYPLVRVLSSQESLSLSVWWYLSSKGFSGVTTLPLCPTLSWDPTPCLFSLHSYTLPTSSFTSSEKLSPRGVGQVSKPYWTGSVLTTYTVCMFWLQFVWIATTSQNTNAIHLYCILPYSEWSLRFRTHIREGFRYTCIHDRTYFSLVLD